VGKSIAVIGTLDINSKLDIIQPMLNPSPPSRLSAPIRACPVMRPKGCEPILLEAFHQYLWVDSRVRTIVLPQRTPECTHTHTHTHTRAHRRNGA
jgi:hypothetical protein